MVPVFQLIGKTALCPEQQIHLPSAKLSFSLQNSFLKPAKISQEPAIRGLVFPFPHFEPSQNTAI